MYVQALVTLTGSAQKLSTATGTFAPTGVSAAALGNLACREIHMQAESGNSHVVYVGDATVSATLYAFVIPTPVSSVPAAPMIMGPYGAQSIKLDDFYIIGTAAEKVHLGLVI